MAGVRFVAQIFGLLGWVTLVIGGLGILALGDQISAAVGPRGNSMAMAAVASSVVPLILLALGPFFLWALLTGLCELHAQGELVLAAVRHVDRPSSEKHAVTDAPQQDGGQ